MPKKTDKTDQTDAPAVDTAARVRVRVECVALGEGGVTYLRGDIFETTPERAAALGDLVAPAES